jgi:hypothetical protein
VRGEATVEQCDDMVPEYEQAVYRLLGREAGAGWLGQIRGQPMAKITVTPRAVRILDSVDRFPSAMSA